MHLSGRTILVAEDDHDQMVFIATILEDHGATVLKAYNRSQALESIQTGSPDLVTLDITMPGLSTTEFLDRIDATASGTRPKVCIISGRPELRQVLMDRKGVSPDGFLDKPFTEDALLDCVTQLLG